MILGPSTPPQNQPLPSRPISVSSLYEEEEKEQTHASVTPVSPSKSTSATSDNDSTPRSSGWSHKSSNSSRTSAPNTPVDDHRSSWAAQEPDLSHIHPALRGSVTDPFRHARSKPQGQQPDFWLCNASDSAFTPSPRPTFSACRATPPRTNPSRRPLSELSTPTRKPPSLSRTSLSLGPDARPSPAALIRKSALPALTRSGSINFRNEQQQPKPQAKPPRSLMLQQPQRRDTAHELPMSMNCADLPASYVADAKAYGGEAKEMSWLRKADVPDDKGGVGLLLGGKEA
ncbi:hypothetical protein LTS18_001846, partial [Coniosporium uncinatum]